MPKKPMEQHQSLQSKLRRSGVVGLTLLAAIGVLTVFFIRNAIRDAANRELTSVAQLQSERVAGELAANSAALTRMAEQVGSPVASGDIDAVKHELQDFVEGAGSLAWVGVLRTDGTVFASTAGAVTPGQTADQATVKAAVDGFVSGSVVHVGRAFAAPTGEGRYLHAASIEQPTGGQLLLVAECRLDAFDDMLRAGRAPERTLDMHLVQRVGDVAQFITDLRFEPGSRFVRSVPLTETDAPAVQALTSDAPRFLEGVRDYRGEQVLAVVSALAGTEWGLVVKIDRAEAYHTIGQVVGGVTTAFVVTALLLGAIYLMVSRGLTRRVQRLTESAVAISRGDFGRRMNDESTDEIGRLSRAFDRMVHQLETDTQRRREVEAELTRRAWHDPLTGLPNRSFLFERLSHYLSSPDRRVGQIALLFCDLDAFKDVNDELGHTTGDVLLQTVSERFRALIRGDEVLARFGGDEFVVLCPNLHDPARQASAVADRLRQSLREPIRLGEREAFVTVSIGIAIAGPNASAEMLVRDADAAMYRAKSAGRSRHVVHDADIHAASASRLTARTQLRRAIDTGALTVVFQPIIDMTSGEVCAVEALTRWPRDDGVAMPAEFVPLAEELGLAGALDRWVLETACRAVSTRQLRSIAVNVCMSSIASPAFAEDVLNILSRFGLKASSLCLEISEADLASHETEPALAVIARLRNHGVMIAIDDFGVGHSSLSRLRHLPVDVLKIDRSFVADVHRDPAVKAVCHAVFALGRDLGLRVVAEGVESNEQARALSELGCGYGQGFLFGRPDQLVRPL